MDNTNTRVTFSPELMVIKLQQQLNETTALLNYERNLRKEVEEENVKLRIELKQYQDETTKKRHRRTKEEQALAEQKEYSPLKSNGYKKAQKADSISSYDDYVAIRDYLKNKSAKRLNIRIRNATLWTLGIALGIRVSDLSKLKWRYFFDEDKQNKDTWVIKKRISIYEQKTLKINNALITEVIEKTLNEYLETFVCRPDLSDYLFEGNEDGHIKPNSVYKVLKPAQEALSLPYNFSTHTMRNSFANIVACCGVKEVDMNAITTIQGLLNHSNQTTTLRYLGKLNELYDDSRRKVSDFLLGKSGINELTVSTTNHHSVTEVYDLLEKLVDKQEEMNN